MHRLRRVREPVPRERDLPEDALPAEWAPYTEIDARWYQDKDSTRQSVDEWKPPA